MSIGNLKLALVFLIGGVVFGFLFFDSKKTALAIPYFDLVISPQEIKVDESVNLKIILNNSQVTLFKMYVYKVKDDGEIDSPHLHQQDILQNSSLDYDFKPESEVFNPGKYLVLMQPYISQNKPLVIYQSAFVYFTIVDSFSYQPVLFIHGLGGYNYDGAVEDISADMEQAIATLSAKSINGKVDIVAYSLGSLVARYYLAAHKNNHKVDQVIAIAGPHKGVWILDEDKKLNKTASGQVLSGILKTSTLALFNALGYLNKDTPIDYTSPAIQQLYSDSDFLTNLNLIINTPSNVRFYPLYGDIHATFKRKLFHWTIKKEKDIGDGVILAESAAEIAGANNPQKTAYKENSELTSKLVMNADGSWRVDWLGTDSMKYFHTRILEQQELKDKVKQILTNN